MDRDYVRNEPRLRDSTAMRTGGARKLLRSPAVQGVLLMAVAAQGVTSVHNHRQAASGRASTASRGTETTAPHITKALMPVVVARALPEVPATAAKAAPREDKVRALEKKYRDAGYPVTPTLARAIDRAAREAGIDTEMAFGLVRTESSFQNKATSHVGAMGLTQLMPATARWLEPGVTRSDLRDPDTNLRIGFRYLKDLIEKYDGNTRLALLAYNRGPGTVDRVLKRGGNPDNGYADAVLSGGKH